MSTALLQTVRAGLVAKLNPLHVDELLASYVEAKENFFAGGLRLSAVEGGRFCEAAFRLLQEAAQLPVTKLGSTVKTDTLIKALENLPRGQAPDSIRLHIPRALRVIYDIRNNRDAAHLADGIDPNLQDATLVATVLDWVLAEFVRLYHNISADEAQKIVESLVTRRAPVVETFGTFLKVLNAGLQVSDMVLVLLYQRGKAGATFNELESWVRPVMRKNLGRTLERLEHVKAFVHNDGGKYVITQTGMFEVEQRKLYRLPAA
jgi:hypothetical protein